MILILLFDSVTLIITITIRFYIENKGRIYEERFYGFRVLTTCGRRVIGVQRASGKWKVKN